MTSKHRGRSSHITFARSPHFVAIFPLDFCFTSSDERSLRGDSRSILLRKAAARDGQNGSTRVRTIGPETLRTESTLQTPSHVQANGDSVPSHFACRIRNGRLITLPRTIWCLCLTKDLCLDDFILNFIFHSAEDSLANAFSSSLSS